MALTERNIHLIGFYSPATRAWEFAVGALLALGGARLAVTSARRALPLMLAGAGIVAASLWIITATTPFPGMWTLLPLAGTSILIAAGTADTVVSRALASRRMVDIGDRSYSIYLWHWPFIVFAGLLWPESRLAPLAAAAVSFIPAYASYRWVEQPMRRLPITSGRPLARLVATTLIPPLALAVALGLAYRHGMWNPTVQEYQVAIQTPHASQAASCTEEAWRNPEDCTWNADAAGRPIYLVGDSNADHFSEALIGAAKSGSRPLVTLAEGGGCTYVHAPPQVRYHGFKRLCVHYQGNTADYLVTAEPGTVVIANSYPYWLDSHIAVGTPGQPPGQDLEIKLDALNSGLTAAVRELQDAGHNVLLVQTIPHWGDIESLNWKSCSTLDVVAEGCNRTMPLSEPFERQSPAADVVAGVALATGAHLLDVSSELCPDGACSAISSDGLIRYADATHITVQQSEALTETFARAIAAVG